MVSLPDHAGLPIPGDRSAHVGRCRRNGALTAAWGRAREAIVRHPVDLYSLQPLGELLVGAARLREQRWVAPHLDEAWAILGRLGSPALWSVPLHWSCLQAGIAAGLGDVAAQHAAALAEVAESSRYATEVPLVTTHTVRRILNISAPAAHKAVEELAEAGVVIRKSLERGTIGYFARDVFELLTFAERRLASTRWDTRETPPSRPVPALPQT